MCGRYFIDANDPSGELNAIIAQIPPSSGNFKRSGEIFPTDSVPVIANNRSLSATPFAMRWGYSFSGGGSAINARSETAAKKPMFSDGMAQRRCLIPASYYFEWEKSASGRVKYALSPRPIEEAYGLIYMAGIYRLTASGAEFTILTRAAAPEIAFIHDRMPVILPKDMTREWLRPQNDASAMLSAALNDINYLAV